MRKNIFLFFTVFFISQLPAKEALYPVKIKCDGESKYWTLRSINAEIENRWFTDFWLSLNPLGKKYKFYRHKLNDDEGIWYLVDWDQLNPTNTKYGKNLTLYRAKSFTMPTKVPSTKFNCTYHPKHLVFHYLATGNLNGLKQLDANGLKLKELVPNALAVSTWYKNNNLIDYLISKDFSPYEKYEGYNAIQIAFIKKVDSKTIASFLRANYQFSLDTKLTIFYKNNLMVLEAILKSDSKFFHFSEFSDHSLIEHLSCFKRNAYDNAQEIYQLLKKYSKGNINLKVNEFNKNLKENRCRYLYHPNYPYPSDHLVRGIREALSSNFSVRYYTSPTTPFLRSAEFGDLEMVKIMVNEGLDLEMVPQIDFVWQEKDTSLAFSKLNLFEQALLLAFAAEQKRVSDYLLTNFPHLLKQTSSLHLLHPKIKLVNHCYMGIYKKEMPALLDLKEYDCAKYEISLFEDIKRLKSLGYGLNIGFPILVDITNLNLLDKLIAHGLDLNRLNHSASIFEFLKEYLYSRVKSYYQLKSPSSEEPSRIKYSHYYIGLTKRLNPTWTPILEYQFKESVRYHLAGMQFERPKEQEDLIFKEIFGE